jgi:radical SAM enzyme (rSAM/lipoprotein system)
MPFEDFLKALLSIKSLVHPKNVTIIMTGGEPLTRPDLAKCGATLKQHGFGWGIVTNGLYYDNNTHAQLLSAGMGSLSLSLDGLEKNHNYLRNNIKSFENAVHALALIVASKQLNYDIVTCVHHRNINELHELKQFLIQRGVKKWRLFTIAPIGRAKNNPEMQISREDLQSLIDFLMVAREDKRIHTTFSCEAFLGNYDRKVRDTPFFCRAGINIASILVDGSISACPNINRGFAQGNIYKDTLVEVWNKRYQMFRDKTWTKTGICARCKDYQFCKGGAMHLWDESKNGIAKCLYQTLFHP